MLSRQKTAVNLIRNQKTITLSFAFISFTVIALVPLAMLLVTLPSADLGTGLVDWLQEKRIVQVTWDSLHMASVATIVSLLLGLPLGLVLGADKKMCSSGLFLLFLLPLAIPPYVTAGCWQSVLGFDGTVNRLLPMVGGWQEGVWGCGAILGFSYFPILVYLVISGRHSIDPHYEEAGLFSFSEWGVFWRITLPLLLPHIATALVFVFLLSLTNYAVPSLLGVRTFTVKIYTYFAVFQEPAGAVLMALPLLSVCLVATLILSRIMGNKHFFFLARPPGNGSVMRILQSPFFRLAVYGMALSVTAAPVINLIWRVRSVESVKIAFSQVAGTMAGSFLLAIGGSFFLTMLAFPMGYGMEKLSVMRKAGVRAVFLFPFATPAVLLAIGVVYFWNRPGLEWGYQSFLIMIILWGAKYLPIGQRIIADHVSQIPEELEEAAFLSSLSWLRSMVFIVWPMVRPGFLVAWAVTYIFCLTELGGTLLLIPPGIDSMPVRLYNMMHYGTSELVAVLSLMMLGMVVLPVACVFTYGKRRNFFNAIKCQPVTGRLGKGGDGNDRY